LCVASGTIATPRVATATSPVPSTAAPAVATATCPAGTLLLSGGFRIDGTPRPDAHVRGSYPSASDGSPVSDAPVAGSWTSIAEGDGATPAVSTVFAVCS
jgi:hypothetical protein